MPKYLKTAFSHILLLILFTFQVKAQSTPELVLGTVEKEAAPAGFQNYWEDAESLLKSPLHAEMILDLFEPAVLDSTIHPKTQRHRFPLSFTLEYVFKFYWEAIEMKKLKMVGTCARDISLFDGPLKEFDANYFPTPHLPHYVSRLLMGKAAMKTMGRGVGHAKIYDPPFECAEALKIGNKGYLCIESECTPRRDLRQPLDSLFFPAVHGSKMKNHPNFGTPYTSVGFFGPFVVDCNHACQPEIHPWEWMWWTDLNSRQGTAPQTRSFLIGFFQDVSKRFRNWSKSPKTGSIRIPVAFPARARQVKINSEYLVCSEFTPEDLPNMPPRGGKPLPGDFREVTAELDGKEFVFTQNGPIPAEGVYYSFSDWKLDQREGLYWGYLYLHLSVKNLYTGRITVSWE